MRHVGGIVRVIDTRVFLKLGQGRESDIEKELSLKQRLVR